jgi:hypothetical protein
VPFDPTARRVWGAAPLAETPALPFQGPSGSSQAHRPDRKPWGLSTLGVERAGPLWGKPEEGHAAAKTRPTTRLSALRPLLAPYGGPPGATLSRADAALVTEDQRAARRDPLGLTRLPAPYRARGRGLAEAGAHPAWEEGGGWPRHPRRRRAPAPSRQSPRRVAPATAGALEPWGGTPAAPLNASSPARVSFRPRLRC